MTHKEALQASRQRKLVPDSKFDRHMKRARVKDIESRKAIFNEQTTNREHNRIILASIY